ncbi:hypothetical protein SS50377_26575 [Spironucleus salmonicida]|uniref:Myb-like DNA-binding domain-containing protein n=1 Tax=Spironucleus salmonicida TaxID=348837 RepID=V6LB22_9EUKA|nr:hypothetical protein SS50377_26575 [Spironucleus salmonicida]|eukprot:EST41428.1 Hypothetical protein SS50377_19145 [Spironucleus salmonicida]
MTKQNYSKWTGQEEEVIKAEINNQLYILNRGKLSWIQISKVIETKTPRQCYDWYQIRKDRQSEKPHQWKKEEEELILQLVEQNISIKEISTYFINMSVSQIRNKIRYVNEIKDKKKLDGSFGVFNDLFN